MFFFWFAKNRQFKKGGDLSGQITPFLLVVLVILLIAAIATINVSRVSLDKTCSANAADAGTLAAASSWAAALNSLTTLNKEQIQAWFDMNYATYGQIYDETKENITETIKYAALATAYAVGAAKTIGADVITIDWSQVADTIPSMGETTYNVGPQHCQFWPYGAAGAALNGLAAGFCLDAAKAVGEVNIAALYMQSILDSFYQQQWTNYCDARDFMAEAHSSATLAGLNYAFSNSCISGKLSTDQGNNFSLWMKQLSYYYDDYKNTTDTYSWSDKLEQVHSVSASIDLPDIDSYELQHSQDSYSAISELLADVISRSETIEAALTSADAVLGAIAAILVIITVLTAIAAALCDCGWPPLEAVGAALSTAAIAIYNATSVGQSAIVILLAGIVSAAGGTSLLLLRDENDHAYEGWSADGVQSSYTCEDASDLMIVKIDGLTMDHNNRWTTVCDAAQKHPGTSAGLLATEYPVASSSSTAKFDGGDIGVFDDSYDPEIVGVR